MNNYAKYCPNVFLAKCTEKHERGEIIPVTTKYGKDNECEVFNLILERDGFYYYSIIRADGFNAQERAKAKAERYSKWAQSAEAKSAQFYEASNEGRDFLSLGEPLKVGHHSEKRHRALIDRNWNRMGKSVEMSEKAEAHESKAEYWASRANDINLSMPESLDYYEHKLETAKAKHEGLKNGTIERSHSFSLTYAKKDVNEAEKNLATAKKLWGEQQPTQEQPTEQKQGQAEEPKDWRRHPELEHAHPLNLCDPEGGQYKQALKEYNEERLKAETK